jgi:hypothetical protein
VILASPDSLRCTSLLLDLQFQLLEAVSKVMTYLSRCNRYGQIHIGHACLSLLITTTTSTSLIEDMASILPNASNFKMDNPQFNAIGNQTNIHQSSASDNGEPSLGRLFPRLLSWTL